ncbi:DUF6491 family protein [Lysobacter sp. CA199]|uniref:DUF6491 family protein n=1 Tax=Lysobacter sp. CA199 TaxID=3455608 RepID=UPI003F8D6407
MKTRIVALPLLALASLTSAHADTLTQCVDLDASWQLARARNAVLLKHDRSHYRLDLQSACKDLNTSGKLEITAEQRKNRLCPSGSEIVTSRDRCAVSAIQDIDANAFERARRTR